MTIEDVTLKTLTPERGLESERFQPRPPSYFEQAGFEKLL